MSTTFKILVAVLLVTAAVSMVEGKRRTQTPPAPAPKAPAPAPPAPAPAKEEPKKEEPKKEEPKKEEPKQAEPAKKTTREAPQPVAVEAENIEVPTAADSEAAPTKPEGIEPTLQALRSAKGDLAVGASDDGHLTAAGGVFAGKDIIAAGSVSAGSAVFAPAVFSDNVAASKTVSGEGAVFSGSVGAGAVKVEGAVVAGTVQTKSVALNGEDLQGKLDAMQERLTSAEAELDAKTEKIQELEITLAKIPALTKKVEAVIKLLSKFDLRNDIEGLQDNDNKEEL